MVYFFWCNFKVHLENQSNSKQCVKGRCIIKYWNTVDGMLCFIYYHLDFKKGCWREICNYNFQPLKLLWTIKNHFSTFFVVAISSDISDIFYSGYYWFYENLTSRTKSCFFAVSSIKLFLKIVNLENIWVTSKAKVDSRV